VDGRDWQTFGDCFTDPVQIGHSQNGLAAGEYARGDFVSIVREGIGTFAHLAGG
jgi:hypothetical protein